MDFGGRLFYGMALPKGDRYGWNDKFQERKDEYEEARQAREVSEPFDDGGYKTPAWDAWRKKLKRWELKQCTWSYSGDSDSNSRPFLKINESEHEAEWDNLVEIKNLDIKPEWRERIIKYCEDLKIPFKEPKWYLAAHYSC